ncbi:hypothetical protein SASPL_112082 [Salvia splendens]|uniref:Cytoskeleton-associated protein 5 n=1 Tax=Salvia splendens TaxID=180675 RepID=A0A8X8YD64_SALSN|nr:hypothetical protein SASPL_112082 [Salvia splendens]
MVGGFICIFSGVLDAYTKLRYLSYVMDISTATVDYLDLVHDILLPVVIKDKSRFSGRRLAAPALDPALKLYKWLHDILSPRLRNILLKSEEKLTRKDHSELVGEGAYVKSKKTIGKIRGPVRNVKMGTKQPTGFTFTSLKSSSTVKLETFQQSASTYELVQESYSCMLRLKSSIEEDALGMQPGPGEARVADISDESGKKRVHICSRNYRLRLCFGDCDERPTVSAQKLVATWFVEMVGGFICIFSGVLDAYTKLRLSIVSILYLGNQSKKKLGKIQLYIKYSTTADESSCKCTYICSRKYSLRLCFGDCDERPTVSAKKLVVATWFVDEFGVLDAYTKAQIPFIRYGFRHTNSRMSVFWGKFLFKLSRYTLWSFRITRHLMNIKDVLKLYKWLHDILSPEVLSEGLSWMVSAVDDFGTSHIKLKVLKTYRFRKVDKVTDSTSTAVSGGITGMDGLPRQDISEKTTPPPPLKGLEGSDLKVRLESIESVTKILEEANKPILPAGTGDLFGALKGRPHDIEKSGKGILSDALKCLECTMRVPMLGAAHLDKMLPYIILSDAEIGIEGRRDLFKWLSRRQLTGLVSFLDEIKLLKPTASAMMVFHYARLLFCSKQLKPYGALQDNYESGRSVSSRLSDLNRGHSLVKIMQVIAIATTEGFKNEAKNMLVASGNIEHVYVPTQHLIRLVMDRQRREEELKGPSKFHGFFSSDVQSFSITVFGVTLTSRIDMLPLTLIVLVFDSYSSEAVDHAK